MCVCVCVCVCVCWVKVKIKTLDGRRHQQRWGVDLFLDIGHRLFGGLSLFISIQFTPPISPRPPRLSGVAGLTSHTFPNSPDISTGSDRTVRLYSTLFRIKRVRQHRAFPLRLHTNRFKHKERMARTAMLPPPSAGGRPSGGKTISGSMRPGFRGGKAPRRSGGSATNSTRSHCSTQAQRERWRQGKLPRSQRLSTAQWVA